MRISTLQIPLAMACRLRFAMVAAMFAIPLAARADVKLASLFTDHMVVQRNQPVHVWGWADAAERGSVSFRGKQASFAADALGEWSVFLPAGEAGGPFELSVETTKLNVESTNHIVLKDVLVGDVWVASGQSNMEFTMRDRLANGAVEIAAANYPQIRLLTVEKKVSDHPVDDASVRGWSVCTPASAGDFSAIAYFFGRDLNKTQKVPIGLIDSTWGGTPAEAWTSLDALTSGPALMPVFAARASMTDKLGTIARQELAEKRINRERAASGKPAQDVPWRPNPDTWAPAALFNGMIAPLTPLPIRGVLWYQGESNTDAMRAPVYEALFRTMIADWRRQWGEAEMPFLFVQLANFVNKDDWPTVREAQRKTLELRDTGMAVTIDVGESKNIHPADKQDVGMRLALLARSMVYGEAVEDSGPLFLSAARVESEMVVSFTHAEGLRSRSAPLRCFEVAGEDGRFVAASGRIEGEKVIAGSAQVDRPRFVRFGWENDPQCSLVNGAGLPASPFSSR